MHLDGNNFGHGDKTCQALDKWLKNAKIRGIITLPK